VGAQGTGDARASGDEYKKGVGARRPGTGTHSFQKKGKQRRMLLNEEIVGIEKGRGEANSLWPVEAVRTSKLPRAGGGHVLKKKPKKKGIFETASAPW